MAGLPLPSTDGVVLAVNFDARIDADLDWPSAPQVIGQSAGLLQGSDDDGGRVANFGSAPSLRGCGGCGRRRVV